MAGLVQLLLKSLPEAIGGLAVVAILALLGLLRRRLLNPGQQVRQTPRVPGPGLSFPPQQRLKDKLDRLHGLSDCPFVLVGSVYLDVILRPVATTELGKDEWSNIDPIECVLGGSSLWVGRYLWKLYGKKSYLFSKKGRGRDPLTREFDRLIAHERRSWLINQPITGPPNSRTAVTVHLVQQGEEFTTMFTHRGVLAGFGWNDLKKQLSQTLAGGGVLYLSGYMKTNLYEGLQATLRELHQNILICVDHGRLAPGKFVYAEQALRNVFRQGLVDLYFCTCKELLDLCGSSGNGLSHPDCTEAALEELANCGLLPIVTIVRDSGLPGKTKAYAIIGKSVHPLEGKAGQFLLRDSVGPKNAFNAAVIFHLIHGEREDGLEDLVIKAGTRALQGWYRAPYLRWS